MICPECKTEVKEGTSFCPNCGANLEAFANVTAKKPNEKGDSQAAKDIYEETSAGEADKREPERAGESAEKKIGGRRHGRSVQHSEIKVNKSAFDAVWDTEPEQTEESAEKKEEVEVPEEADKSSEIKIVKNAFDAVWDTEPERTEESLEKKEDEKVPEQADEPTETTEPAEKKTSKRGTKKASEPVAEPVSEPTNIPSIGQSLAKQTESIEQGEAGKTAEIKSESVEKKEIKKESEIQVGSAVKKETQKESEEPAESSKPAEKKTSKRGTKKASEPVAEPVSEPANIPSIGQSLAKQAESKEQVEAGKTAEIKDESAEKKEVKKEFEEIADSVKPAEKKTSRRGTKKASEPAAEPVNGKENIPSIGGSITRQEEIKEPEEPGKSAEIKGESVEKKEIKKESEIQVGAAVKKETQKEPEEPAETAETSKPAEKKTSKRGTKKTSEPAESGESVKSGEPTEKKVSKRGAKSAAEPASEPADAVIGGSLAEQADKKEQEETKKPTGKSAEKKGKSAEKKTTKKESSESGKENGESIKESGEPVKEPAEPSEKKPRKKGTKKANKPAGEPAEEAAKKAEPKEAEDKDKPAEEKAGKVEKVEPGKVIEAIPKKVDYFEQEIDLEPAYEITNSKGNKKAGKRSNKPYKVKRLRRRKENKGLKIGLIIVAVLLLLALLAIAGTFLYGIAGKMIEQKKKGKNMTSTGMLIRVEGMSPLYLNVEPGRIDLSARNVTPGTKEPGKTWDDTLYYWLEDCSSFSDEDGNLSKCNITRTLMLDSVDGSEIQFECYRDADSGQIYKIVSIKDNEGSLELTDFYYKDEKPYYVSIRNDSIYTPTYISSDHKGEQYYFMDDVLVRWRIINEPKVIEEYTISPDGAKYTQVDYFSLDEGVKKFYDQKEEEVLNLAYNVLNGIKEDNGIGTLEGIVKDTSGNPLSGVSVYVIKKEDNSLLYQFATGADGSFSGYINVGNEPCYLNVSERSDEYKTLLVNGPDIKEDAITYNLGQLVLHKKNEGEFPVHLKVFDAAKTKTDAEGTLAAVSMKDVEVKFREGIGMQEGDVVASVKTSVVGEATVNLPAGTYTAEFSAPGYATGYMEVDAGEGTECTGWMVPKLATNQSAIVLTWEGEETDLDLTVFTPNRSTNGDMAYIGGSMTSDGKENYLVSDNKSGCELVYIKTFKTGSYKIFVNDHTNSQAGEYASDTLAARNARVYIYNGNYNVMEEIAFPYNQSGAVWEVAEINRDKRASIQRTYRDLSGKNLWLKKKTVDWKDDLIAKVNESFVKYEEFSSSNHYGLICINEDDIPELIVAPGKSSRQLDLCCYGGEWKEDIGGKVSAKDSTVFYTERDNEIYVVSSGERSLTDEEGQDYRCSWEGVYCYKINQKKNLERIFYIEKRTNELSDGNVQVEYVRCDGSGDLKETRTSSEEEYEKLLKEGEKGKHLSDIAAESYEDVINMIREW